MTQLQQITGGLGDDSEAEALGEAEAVAEAEAEAEQAAAVACASAAEGDSTVFGVHSAVRDARRYMWD
jgi:DUF1680 family protein